MEDRKSRPAIFYPLSSTCNPQGFSRYSIRGNGIVSRTCSRPQIQATAPLASNASTPQGYFLGSCFFQHTLVDLSRFEAFDTTGTFSARTANAGAPCPACGQAWRVDALTPLPVWTSVTTGYVSLEAPADTDSSVELPADPIQ